MTTRAAIETAGLTKHYPGVQALNDFHVATRLSYFLWSTTPDGVTRAPRNMVS